MVTLVLGTIIRSTDFYIISIIVLFAVSFVEKKNSSVVSFSVFGFVV